MRKDISKVEAALIVAKTKCLKLCGAAAGLDAEALAKLHEPHRAALEQAYLAFQRASGEYRDSNPASGKTTVSASLIVDAGLNRH